MNWEELKEKAKSFGVLKVLDVSEKYISVSQRANHYIKFYKNGDVCVVYDDEFELELLIAEKVEPEQMWQIMEALK